MSEKELLEEIKRHIDYTNAMGEKSLRDLQMENLYNLLQQKNNIIKEAKEELNNFNESYLIDEGDYGVYNLLKAIIEKLDKGE